MRRKTIAWTVLAFVVAAPVLAFAGAAFFLAQRADYGWRPGITAPRFAVTHPRVAIDAGHHNASTGELTSRYWPFARLLRADGYSVETGRGRFSHSSLADLDVLVVANASGGAKKQVFGMNVPFTKEGERGDPAFTPDEIAAVHDWVAGGGSLLLVADHAPFGQAAAAMGAAFGVTMHQGFVELEAESSDPLLFSTANGRLPVHPILAGPRADAAVSRVQTFTGQSLDGPPGSTILLRLPPTALESVPERGRDAMSTEHAGQAQGLAFELGAGRVVVLGEAAMLTAQVAGRKPFGMDPAANDNEAFARNLMWWLARGDSPP
jgi:hypothetical protein